MLDSLWRVTRTRPARAVYDALAARDLKAATMLLYVRRGLPEPTPTEGVSFARWTGGVGPDAAFEELDPGDEALVALCEGRYAGRVFLSDRPVFVPAIDERVDREGAYVWRLFVDPAYLGGSVADSNLELAALLGLVLVVLTVLGYYSQGVACRRRPGRDGNGLPVTGTTRDARRRGC